MVYLSDAVVLFSEEKEGEKKVEKHWIPFTPYYMLNMVSFCSLIICCLLFGMQWIEIANNIRDEPNANKGFKKFVKILVYSCPFLIAAQSPFVFYEMYQAVTLLFGIISLMIGTVATYSGILFRRSLGEYFSGSYINNVSSVDFMVLTFIG